MHRATTTVACGVIATATLVFATGAGAASRPGSPVASLDCLTGVWDYESFVNRASGIDLTFTGVNAEFGAGYFHVDGVNGTATGFITGFEDPGDVITTSLAVAGSLSALEDGTFRFGVVTDTSAVSVNDIQYPGAPHALVPDTPLTLSCSGDAASLTTRSDSTLTFSRRSDLHPAPPAELPATPERNPVLDCVEGYWAMTHVAAPATNSALDVVGMTMNFADGLMSWGLGRSFSGTLNGAVAYGQLGGSSYGFYSASGDTITYDGINGEGGALDLVVNDAAVDVSQINLEIVPAFDTRTVACDGDVATLSSSGGDVFTLRRLAQPGTLFMFPYSSYFDVPQLGTEPVQGTGCGGDGSIGDVIPDGLWRGSVTTLDAATASASTSLEFDLICAYTGDVGLQMFNEFIAAHPDYASPPWDGSNWIVNNNPRTRTVPLAGGFGFREAQWLGGFIAADGAQDMSCVVPPETQPIDVPPLAQYNDEWLYIEDGQAQWAVASCPHD